MDALKTQAAMLGIASRVTLAGHRADVPALLGAIDVFAISSTYEGIRSRTHAMLRSSFMAGTTTEMSMGGSNGAPFMGRAGLQRLRGLSIPRASC